MGLQIAVWELEYGARMSNLTIVDEFDTTTGGPNGIVNNPAPPGPFDPTTATAFAAKFLSEAQGKNEAAIYLDVSADNPAPASLQGLLAPMPTPTIVTTASLVGVNAPGDNAAGDAIPQDSAVLSGGYSPGGSLTFNLTAPDNTVVDTETIAVTGDGTYPTANTHVATQVGTYTWSVSYSGDGVNNGAQDQGPTGEQVTTIATSLSINKDDHTPTYIPGTSTTYTIIVTNNGLSTVTGATVTDPLPAGTTFISASGGATDNAGTVSYTTGTLAPGGTATFTVTIGNLPLVGPTTNNADFTTFGANNTPQAQNVTVNGVRADAFYVDGSGYETANTTLFLRNEPNDHGLGIVSNGEVASQGGDVNEISNQLNLDVLRLKKNAGDTWTSLWVSSLDSGGSGGREMGTLYWSNSPTPDLSKLTGFTFKFGDFGSSVEGDLLTLHPAGFDATAQYLFFRAGPNPCGTNNDYLFWKATTTTPGQLCNTATVTPPAGVININPNNSSTDCDTPTKAAPTIVTVASPGGVQGAVSLTDTATLSGSVSVGSGATITFTLTAPDHTTTTETVPVTVDGNYVTPTPVLATQAGTYTWSATYSGNISNNSATDNGQNETAMVTAPPITIKGTKFSDITGNGFSADDKGLGGVSIALYKESNGHSGLQTGSGGDYLVATTTTASDGSYSFGTGLVAGATYYVVEVVPTGSVQTGGGPNGSAGCTYYTICAQTGKTYAGNDFDDYQKGTCAPTNVCFLVGGCTTVHDLRGNTQQGQTVTVTFTTTMTEQLTLVSYTAPGSSYSQSTAYLQQIFDQATGTFAPGVHTLTVQIPNGFYQVDFVCGAAINPLAPRITVQTSATSFTPRRAGSSAPITAVAHPTPRLTSRPTISPRLASGTAPRAKASSTRSMAAATRPTISAIGWPAISRTYSVAWQTRMIPWWPRSTQTSSESTAHSPVKLLPRSWRPPSARMPRIKPWPATITHILGITSTPPIQTEWGSTPSIPPHTAPCSA